jgi:hypothetical protein
MQPHSFIPGFTLYAGPVLTDQETINAAPNSRRIGESDGLLAHHYRDDLGRLLPLSEEGSMTDDMLLNRYKNQVRQLEEEVTRLKIENAALQHRERDLQTAVQLNAGLLQQSPRPLFVFNDTTNRWDRARAEDIQSVEAQIRTFAIWEDWEP